MALTKRDIKKMSRREVIATAIYNAKRWTSQYPNRLIVFKSKGSDAR